MRGQQLVVPVDGGELGGWVSGDGPRVLLIHGGPGLSYEVMDDLADEIGAGYRVASYQQRGIAPSMTEGPYDVATHLADVRAVLDALGWDRAYVVGHSWGGHLALHVALDIPDRLLGVLCVDLLGGVGDGGGAAFEAEMAARTPEDARVRATELDERAMRGEGTTEDALESLRLMWPAYYPTPESAPPMPDVSLSVEAYAGGFESLTAELPALTERLARISVPLGVVAGAASPMPVDLAARATADAIPGAWLEVVAGAGHFPWQDRPGCVRAGLDRLAGELAEAGTTVGPTHTSGVRLPNDAHPQQ
jgi:proline iminopeptidase